MENIFKYPMIQQLIYILSAVILFRPLALYRSTSLPPRFNKGTQERDGSQ
jgi:hypothetical protein